MASTEDSTPPDQESILNINVGVLGHIDSGKTSLVKALSTLLSTAALDKSKQSRERGITLDLGFSCFYLDMPEHLAKEFPDKSQLQITLVDCPGHASLIRTIIGGAQIIDMALLVVDAYKGWQAQTTECLVLAELCSPHLVVALNKADMFESSTREERVKEAADKVRKRLARTRFAQAPIVGVAASVGGEKVAAETENGRKNESYNMPELVTLLRNQLPRPRRSDQGPFYFAIDHCFPIRGRGTVLTGTVLSGKVSVNDTIEFPTLGLDRKVKSMQQFKRQIQSIQQGDRAGICVSHLDAALLERGMASAPGAVPVWKGALAVVRKVPYYKGAVNSAKFHISVGHTTLMAVVTFFGARELAQRNDAPLAKAPVEKGVLSSSSLGGDADLAGLPRIAFDFGHDFLHQDGLLTSLDGAKASSASGSESNQELLHWALLDFATPVHCPVHSLIIGSRLDTVDSPSGDSSSCRLVFSGRLVQPVDPEKDSTRLRIYTPKERRGVISKLGEPYRRSDDSKIVRYEVFGSDLFKKETNMKIFMGMKVETEAGDVGEIKSSFGTSGKFRVSFPAGTMAREGEALVMRFKRYANDTSKAMHQDLVLPKARTGSRIETEKKQKKKEEKGVNRVGEVSSVKGDVLSNGKHNMAVISGFFSPEINIKEKAGTKVFIPSTGEEGSVVGPFGKAGKCKVSFENGVSAEVGVKAELQL